MKIAKAAELITRVAKETGLTPDQVASVLAAVERIRAEERCAKAEQREAKVQEALNRRLGRID